MTWQTLMKLAHDDFYRSLFFVHIPSLTAKVFSFFTRMLKKKNHRENQSEPSIRQNTIIKKLEITNITNNYNCQCLHDFAFRTSSIERTKDFPENRARPEGASPKDKTKMRKRRIRKGKGFTRK